MDKAKKRIVGIGVIAVIAFAFALAASGSGVIEQNAEENGGVTVAASEVTSRKHPLGANQMLATAKHGVVPIS